MSDKQQEEATDEDRIEALSQEAVKRLEEGEDGLTRSAAWSLLCCRYPGESKNWVVERVTQIIADAIREAVGEVNQRRDNAYALLEGERKSSETLHITVEKQRDQLAVAREALEQIRDGKAHARSGEYVSTAMQRVARAALAEIEKMQSRSPAPNPGP